MSETQTLYKLIILYMLNRVTFPLSNAQLSEFILEKEYTDYFTLQQAIFELNDSNLIRLEPKLTAACRSAVRNDLTCRHMVALKHNRLLIITV